MARKSEVIVIGAGLNGMAAGSVLARAGHEVLVLESRDVVGGMNGLRPVFADCWAPAGLNDGGRLLTPVAAALGIDRHRIQSPVASKDAAICASDGTRHRYSTSSAILQRELGGGVDGPRFQQFRRSIEAFVEIFRDLYSLAPPPGGAPPREDLWSWLKLALKVRGLGPKEIYEFLRILPQPIEDLLNEWFDADWLKAALAAPSCHSAFLGPCSAGTGMRLLHHLATGQGAVQLTDGVDTRPGELAGLFAEALEKSGGRLRKAAPVARILVENEQVAGLVLRDGEEIPARHVLSSLDPRTTFEDMVGTDFLGPQFVRDLTCYRSEGTVARVHLRVDRLPKFLQPGSGDPPLAHALFVDDMDHLERVNDDLKYGRVSESPVLSVVASSVLAPGSAPDGQHVLSIQVESVPAQPREAAWSDVAPKLLDKVVATLGNHDPGFSDSILDRRILGPMDLEQELGCRVGHLHHGDLTLDQFFLLRPVPQCARYSTPIRGLYLCGAATHPGGPSGGWSGVNAASAWLREQG